MPKWLWLYGFHNNKHSKVLVVVCVQQLGAHHAPFWTPSTKMAISFHLGITFEHAM